MFVQNTFHTLQPQLLLFQLQLLKSHHYHHRYRHHRQQIHHRHHHHHHHHRHQHHRQHHHYRHRHQVHQLLLYQQQYHRQNHHHRHHHHHLRRRQRQKKVQRQVCQVSVDIILIICPSDENLNRSPLVLLLRSQYRFPFGINIVQFFNFFPIFNFSICRDICLSEKTEALGAALALTV